MPEDTLHTPDPIDESQPRQAEGFELGFEVDRDRAPRPRFVARPVYAAATLLVVFLVALGSYLLYVRATRPVVTPTLIGMSQGEAETYLRQRDFQVGTVIVRAGGVEKGRVLAQTPAPESPIAVGDSVDLVVSAGAGRSQVPDVVGVSFALAAGRLEMAGIPFEIEYSLSNESSGTVLSVEPQEGTLLQSGDSVRITLAYDAISARRVIPFDLAGFSVALQPSELPANQRDVTLAIANRLGGLLEISGAAVLYTRDNLTTAEEKVPEAVVARIAAAAPDTLIVLDADASVEGGIRIRYGAGPIADTSDENRAAVAYAAAIARETARGLSEFELDSTLTHEESLIHSGEGMRPWVVVSLGSYRKNTDLHAWGQAEFTGDVARSIYLGIARAEEADLKD